MAISHIHKNETICKDIKAENILIEPDGYIKLTNLNLAKHVQSNNIHIGPRGTIDYNAPETILSEPVGKPVDWWALGILLYELIVGMPPFYHPNLKRVKFLICQIHPMFPDSTKHKSIQMSEDCKDLITKLLDKDPKKRLGTKNGAQEVLAHVFFEDIDKQKLLKKNLPAPYTFELGDDQMQYFSKKYENKTDFPSLT